MRTTGSDDLYRLIHSLTTEEKGYFKKFAKRHTSGGNKYLQLFDAINRQPVFEEAALKKKFKGLADMKNYLFEMILQSVIASGSTALLIDKIMVSFLKINILERKGLAKKALQQLTELKKLTEEMEMHTWKAALLRAEINLTFTRATPQQGLAISKNIHREILRALHLQSEQEKLLQYQRLLVSFLKIKEYAAKPINIDKEVDVSFLLRFKPVTEFQKAVWLTSLRVYYRLKNDEERAYFYSEKLYRLQRKIWLRTPTLKETLNYHHCATSFITSCICTHRFRQLEKVYGELKEVDASNTPMAEDFETEMNNVQMLLYWYKGEHLGGEEQCARLFDTKDKFDTRTQLWALNLESFVMKALFQFSNAHFTESVRTLNYFNQIGLRHFSKAYQLGAEFLRVLIQLEIENYTQILPLIKSIKTRFKALSKDEAKFLALVKKYYTEPRLLYSYYEKEGLDVIIFNAFDIGDWVESKRLRIPLTQLLRRKYF